MTVSSKISSIIYSCDGQTTVFDVPFRFLEDSDLQLSIQESDGSVNNLVLNSDYTVTGANADGGGKVHLTHPAPAQSKLSILRVMDLLQETDYRENERFPAESHERALDKLTFEAQQLQAQLDRAIKVDVFSDVDPDVLRQHIERVWESCDNIDTVADDITNVDTVSSNISDVNTTATNIADINTNADNITDINTNASNITDITTTASHISAVETVSDNITDVSNVSNSIGNVNTVANDISNVNTVSSNIADVNTVAGISTDVSAVAGISTQVDAVADNKTNINAVADISSKVSTVAAISSDVTEVAGIRMDVQTVSFNSSAVTTAATNIAAIQAAPTAASNAATSANNASIWAEGTDAQVEALGGVHSSKVWAEVSAEGQIQSDWNQADNTKKDYIKNKPFIPTQAGDIGAVEANASITGATKCKITYDAKGLVTAGADLEETDIPSLHLAKVTDVTATATELNTLDGITASTTELNYVTGVTSDIQTQLNGKADKDLSNLTANGLTKIFKTGMIIPWGGTSSNKPDGWLVCDGSAVSRETYADLFAIIGTAYGTGDETTTFNLPNFTGKWAGGNGNGYLSAGLPDVQGTTSSVSNYAGSTSGAFYNSTGYANVPFSQGNVNVLNFKASNSNAIYGAASTVQPPTCKSYWLIKY